MGTRVVTLNASSAGMTRLRDKGGASPTTLYELTNGYVSASKAPTQRPGTTWKFNFANNLATSTTSLVTAGSGSKSFTTQTGFAWVSGSIVRATSRGTGEWMQGTVTGYAAGVLIVTMTSNSGTGTHADWDIGQTFNAGKTKGLVAFKNVLYTFTHDPLYSTSGNASYVIVVLRHPSSTTATLKTIHFAQPFMGLLYVVAEFSDSYIGHYWLQNPPAWQGGVGLPHAYMDNTLVQPIAPNGYYYAAKRTFNPPPWTPLMQYAVNDIVQPSVYNGYYCQVKSEAGSGTPPARSGSTEPVWNLAAVTLDFSTSSPPPTPATPPTPPGATPPGGDDSGRYGNPYRKKAENK